MKRLVPPWFVRQYEADPAGRRDLIVGNGCRFTFLALGQRVPTDVGRIVQLLQPTVQVAMANKAKTMRLKPQLPRGFVDRDAAELRRVGRMMDVIRDVYERYGFDPVETPFFEYTQALGKFLPDEDRPNAGVFSVQDDDGEWLSLRYDLTAPLARYVAENYQDLPKPYRSYRSGWVFRNEKPGPGRFRQFLQFDADSVGAGSVAADAEICMMAADVMEALGIARGDYVIRVNNRKVLDGVMEAIGVGGNEEGKRLSVLRAIDKLDRLGADGVRALLGEGRRDESGDFTKGAGLEADAVQSILQFVLPGAEANASDNSARIESLDGLFDSSAFAEGVLELRQISELIASAGYDDGRVQIDPSVVRGLEYYTGPVFEAELTFQVENEKGKPVVFGSVGGGGRYDGLVGRFRSENVPATGFSLGVSRLAAALSALGKDTERDDDGPVIVTIMDRDRISVYQSMVQKLRGAGIKAELYVGTSGMKAQLKYADRRHAPCVLIQGGDEASRGSVQIKDLVEGKKKAAAVANNEAWREERPGQFEVAENDIVDAVKTLIDRQSIGFDA